MHGPARPWSIKSLTIGIRSSRIGIRSTRTGMRRVNRHQKQPNRNQEQQKRHRYHNKAVTFVVVALGRPGQSARSLIRRFAADCGDGFSSSVAEAWASLNLGADTEDPPAGTLPGEQGDPAAPASHGGVPPPAVAPQDL